MPATWLFVRSPVFYPSGQAAAARVDAAKSRVTASDALYRLAKDRHDTGVATGVDLLRAQVELANDKQALLVAENQYKQVLLSLARNIGMNPGAPIELAEPLTYQPLNRPQIESSISSALLSRSDYLSLAIQRRSLAEQERANHARWYPRISVNGNYGGLGRSIGSVQATGLIQGTVDFTIFDRDRSGETQEIAARLRRVDDQINDLRRGIDEEIREAMLNLESTEEQVQVAKEGQDLAQRELQLAQDRFESGVANNVEVVTAQDSLAQGPGKLHSCGIEPYRCPLFAVESARRHGTVHQQLFEQAVTGRSHEETNSDSDCFGCRDCGRPVFLSAIERKADAFKPVSRFGKHRGSRKPSEFQGGRTYCRASDSGRAMGGDEHRSGEVG